MLDNMLVQTKQEKELQQQIDDIREHIEDIKRNRTITCKGCSKRTPIRNLVLIKPMWYVEPHGCTGGDYWNESDEFKWFCPKCNEWCRELGGKYVSIEQNTRYQFIVQHKAHFGEFYRQYREKTIEELRAKDKTT